MTMMKLPSLTVASQGSFPSWDDLADYDCALCGHAGCDRAGSSPAEYRPSIARCQELAGFRLGNLLRLLWVGIGVGIADDDENGNSGAGAGALVGSGKGDGIPGCHGGHACGDGQGLWV